MDDGDAGDNSIALCAWAWEVLSMQEKEEVVIDCIDKVVNRLRRMLHQRNQL